MRLCIETITVFNNRFDEETGYEVLSPTIIRGVSYHAEVASSVDASGLKAANKFTIRIPADADFSGKAYAAVKDYAGGDPKSTFTLKNGDYIVIGEEGETHTPAQLREKYGDLITIVGVKDNRSCRKEPHWKVVGA